MFISALKYIFHSLLCLVGLHRIAFLLFVFCFFLFFFYRHCLLMQEYRQSVNFLIKFPNIVAVVENRAETEKCSLPLVEVAVPNLRGTSNFWEFSSRQGTWLVLHTYVLYAVVTEIRAIPCYLLSLVISSPGYLCEYWPKEVTLECLMGRPMQQSLSSFLGSPSNAIDDVSVDNGSVSWDCCPNGCSLVFITLWVLPQNRGGEAIFCFKG